jgi:hypothetical protein
LHLEAEKDFLLVGEIPDYPPERRRQLLYQRRRGENLLVLCPLRILEDVHNFELVSPVELLLADPMEIVDCNLRSGARAGDVQRQYVLGQGFLRFVEVLTGVTRYEPASQMGPPVALVEQELPRRDFFGLAEL